MEARAPRIVFAAGGTGGHLFPALAVADELRRRHPEAEITFIGARRGPERRLVPRAGYSLWTLSVSGLKGAGPLRRLSSAAAAGLALLRCTLRFARRRPDLVVGAGSYVAGPAVLAARWLGSKTMVIEQNHFPGATNRFLAKRVDAVCAPSEEAVKRFGGVGLVTGNPVRQAFAHIGDVPDRSGLHLLVFGGSRGAHSINRAVADALCRLGEIDPPPRIVHQTGAADHASIAAAYGSYPEGRFEVLPFIDDMPACMADADLVVCRAGATTLAELAAAGRPAILVPYPFATDDHQRRNAETVARNDAAVIILDHELDGERLATTVASLGSKPGLLRRMGHAARRLARPDAARRIADLADSLLANRIRSVSAGEGGDRVP